MHLRKSRTCKRLEVEEFYLYLHMLIRREKDSGKAVHARFRKDITLAISLYI